MNSLLICVALFGQADFAVPPAPAPAVDSAPAVVSSKAIPVQTLEEQRAWLLGRLTVDNALDANSAADVGRLLNQMNEQQMQELMAAYITRATSSAAVPKTQTQAAQQQALQQAQSTLQQTEAYRDRLQQRYNLTLLQAPMMQNLLLQNMINNQQVMAMYGVGGYTYGPIGFGYGPSAYGSFGYGPMAYGQYGYGMPAYGGPVVYGGRYFNRVRRMGYW